LKEKRQKVGKEKIEKKIFLKKEKDKDMCEKVTFRAVTH